MTPRNFMQLFLARMALGLRLCVGIDPKWERIPKHLMRPQTANVLLDFCTGIFRATSPVAAMFKINAAFFERHGGAGMYALQSLVRKIHTEYSHIPVVVDVKRNDIGESSSQYAKAAFDWIGADGVTLNPYMGQDSLHPFVNHPDKGCFILCLTSNAGADDLENRKMVISPEESAAWIGSSQAMMRQYQIVACMVKHDWNQHGNCGLVVGATRPDELAIVRELIGDEMPLLIPGVGKQGGAIEASVHFAKGKSGKAPFVINVSSDIDFASEGKDFAEAAGLKAQHFDAEFRKFL